MARDRARLDLIISKLKRCCFLPMSTPSASTLASEADQRLFRAVIQIHNHVFRKLLPDVGQTNNDLRPRALKFKLPIKDERNFISRLVYKENNVLGLNLSTCRPFGGTVPPCNEQYDRFIFFNLSSVFCQQRLSSNKR